MAIRATGQFLGAGPGRSHPNGPRPACDGDACAAVVLIDVWLREAETVPAPPHPAALRASAASPRTDALEIAVPVAWTALVVAVPVAGVRALRNARGPSRCGGRRAGGRRGRTGRARRTRASAARHGQGDDCERQSRITPDRSSAAHRCVSNSLFSDAPQSGALSRGSGPVGTRASQIQGRLERAILPARDGHWPRILTVRWRLTLIAVPR
jgi:hypothetical protein